MRESDKDAKGNIYIGQPIERVDGRLKVTGTARYTADMPIPHLAHAVAITSTITRGKILSMDLSVARQVSGVIEIITHSSGLKLHSPKIEGGVPGNGGWMPLQDSIVHWNGQSIGVVVAETLEAATQSAALVRVKYLQESQNVEMERAENTHNAAISLPKGYFNQELQFRRGDSETLLDRPSAGRLIETYRTPFYNHNPIETHATVAVWEGDYLTAYDTTQNVMGTRALLASTLGMPKERVKVITLFLGGGFGCKGFYWPHTSIAAAVARKIRRPVKLVLTRAQMFTLVGHRSPTLQKVSVSAQKDGKILALQHESTVQTSRIAEFVEPCGLVTKMLYETPNLSVSHRLVQLDTGTPCPMRAPGEATGSFALECALDELSYRLGIDPITLRLANYAEKNPEDGKVFSSKHLKECYLRGREAFQWSKRTSEPRIMRDGRWLVGWGMATAAYPANRVSATAKATLRNDGSALVVCATQDIGTGTYTIMSQVAAEALGISLGRVTFELGNTTFPPGPGSGGSQTAASVAPAVQAASREAKLKVIRLAVADQASPLFGLEEEQVGVEDGRLFLRGDSSRGESYSDVLQRCKLSSIDAEIHVEANTRKPGGIEPQLHAPGAPDTSKYSFHSFGAHFVELRVDPELGEVRLSRMLGIYDVGRVLNLKTARSQALGGMAFGVGMALLEDTSYDLASGRIVTSNLADYRVPVNADIPPTEVIFINAPDPQIGPIGMRGLGEIPITGTAAAIANAVYHATGKRIRSLPITPEKLMA